MKHLNESIISKKTGQYLDKWDTKEQIVRFLEHNGYKEIVAVEDIKLRKYGDATGELVYSVGKYDSEPASHWIKFYNPDHKGCVMFCREKEILSKIYGSTAKYATIKYGAWADFSDFNSFRDYVKKNLGF